MSETTSNGFEIEHPVEKMTALEFRDMLKSEFGLDGENPEKRITQLKNLSVEGFAVLLESINKGIQGSSDSLMNHERSMKIGEGDTVGLEDRYDVFSALVEAVKTAPDDINPARIADLLALGTVILHPFHDGSGRTARTIGLMFRTEDLNSPDFEKDYNVVIEPRDEARKRGGFLISGYIPYFSEGKSQTNPEDIKQYFNSLLTEPSGDELYTSCFGSAPLYSK